MKYENPIIRGFYPDPSICKGKDGYYLVTSSFEYFPGVPLFYSKDLFNWRQVGNCLTKEDQFDMDKAKCSHGIFAPTIRYHEGLYYMITTQVGENEHGYYTRNFLVTAEDPCKEWSKPIELMIKGIDPSLFWEDNKAYVSYACIENKAHILLCEIDIITGKTILEPKILTYGMSGRDVEGSHIYKVNEWYYLILAEGGTREGHMVTIARSKNLFGPYEGYEANPILTNRDVKSELECVGHADLVFDDQKKPWFVALGVRAIKHRHTLGRETLLVPAELTKDGWIKSKQGHADVENEVEDVKIDQEIWHIDSIDDFLDGELSCEYISLRKSIQECIINHKNEKGLFLQGKEISLNQEDTPAFIGKRVQEYNFLLETTLCYQPNEEEEAGLTILGDNRHHMEIFLTKRKDEMLVVVRKQIADILVESVKKVKDSTVTLQICGNKTTYEFCIRYKDEKVEKIEESEIKHLATECIDSAFTGTVAGIYAIGKQKVKFDYFKLINID